MNSYTITNPTDIFSLIMDVYGTLEESISFISANNVLISSLGADISMLAGDEVYYSPSLVVTPLPPKPVLATPSIPITNYTWLGRAGQNMFDVCIQTYGILDNQVKLLTDNNLTLTSPVYGQKFNYDSTLIANSSIWNRSTGIDIVFSTGNPYDTFSGECTCPGSFDGSFENLSYETCAAPGSFDGSFESLSYM